MVDFAAKLAELRAKSSSSPVIPAIVPASISPAPAINPVSEQASKLGFELREKVLALEQALLERHPRMPVLLREIHTVLRAQPENVTLFSEDEIAILVSGLKIQTGVEFAASAVKGTGSKAASAKIKALGTGAF